MGKKGKKVVGKIICVRVTDDELETIRQIMEATRMNATAVLREAIKTFMTSTPVN